ncbi:ALQxL family class IV lanthipeptide [Streptomyces griseorubiginosus]
MEFDIEALQELVSQEERAVGACSFTCGASCTATGYCQATCGWTNN